MELPPALRQEVDALLAGASLADVEAAARTLSQRYRAEVHDGRRHLAGEAAARAYLATRLPATFAAARAAMTRIAEVCPDFSPRSVLDAGAGPGTAALAAADCWPQLTDALLIEASPAIRTCGERLIATAGFQHAVWQADDLARDWHAGPPRDLVLLAYVLGELDAGKRAALVDRLWSHTAGMLLLVEPGTPAGWERILAARARLLAAGAHIVAPCPHAAACPLEGPDWCHFARRVARSRLHRLAKGGEVPWEDEKYIFVAMARTPAVTPAARVIARPRTASGRVTLKLCRHDGTAAWEEFSRRQGKTYTQARRLDWSDALQH